MIEDVKCHGDPLDLSRPESTSALRRVVLATFFGQVTEWYDYGIYASVAVALGKTFFPSTDSSSSLLSALAVFGVAFVARPVGGIVIGVLGDRVGRKSVLVLSLVLMTVSTALVGVLPGAAAIGLCAPILLVLARFLQGFSAAGESTAAITFVAESVPPQHKGLFSALLMSGNAAGFLLATAMVWMLQEMIGAAGFLEWGWRLAFLFAVPLGVTGLYIRNNLRETPVFENLQKQKRLSTSPLRDTFTVGLGQLTQAIGISALSLIANYLLVAYLPLHLEHLGFSSRIAFLVTIISTLTLLVSYPLMGALSDRVGRRIMLLGASGFFMLFGWPLFGLAQSNDLRFVILCVCLFALATAAFISCLGLYCTEYIDKSRLMTTYSIGFNLSAAIFGGSSLWVFAKLVQLTGNPRMPAAYLAVAAAISFLSVLSVRRSRETVGVPDTPMI